MQINKLTRFLYVLLLITLLLFLSFFAVNSRNNNTLDNLTIEINKMLETSNNRSKIDFLKSFIIEKLKQNGINESNAKNYLNYDIINFNPQIIALNLGFIDNKINIKKLKSVLLTSSSKISSDFIKKYSPFIKKVSIQYKIPEEIILSILWVETRFGENLGNHSVLNVYFNLSLLQHPVILKELTLWFKDKYRIQNYLAFQKKAILKSQWGFKELISLISISVKYNVNIKSLYGSYAGAFGICQFIPSSYLAYAKDGDEDGIIDLFNAKDAIVSTANYLSRMGWTQFQHSQHRAILSYNNSTPYLTKVIDNSARLRQNTLPFSNLPVPKNISEIKKISDKLIKLNNNLY
ncbi:MAG: lytic murein transglycosylase [Spirochaetota bacterium]|nr:lytic murein transglycosylase [Spirochaetota bacterium]